MPVAWYEPLPAGPKPKLSEVAVTDFGQTVRLGKYEAPAAAILRELFGTWPRYCQIELLRTTPVVVEESKRRSGWT